MQMPSVATPADLPSSQTPKSSLPAFTSPEAEIQRALGTIVHLMLCCVLLLLCVRSVFGRDPVELSALGFLTALALCIEIAYLRGHRKNLPSMIVYSLIAYSAVGIAAYGSVRSVAVLGFAAALATGGFFLSRKALTAAVLCVCLVLAGLIFAEIHHSIERKSFAVGIDTWLMYSIIFAGFAINVYGSRGVSLRALEAQALQLKRAEAAEQEARSSRERLSMVYRNSPGAILVIEVQNHTIVEVNEAFERLFGLMRSEVVGKTSEQIKLWASDQERLKSFTLLARYGEVRNFLTQGRRQDGRHFDMLVSSSVVPNSSPRMAISQITDVTESRRREMLLSDMARGFSGEVGEALLKSLVKHLARAMGADRVLIGELVTPENGGPTSVHGLAMLQDGFVHDAPDYGLANSPCGEALDSHGILAFDDNLGKRFPVDLEGMWTGYEAYIGTALRDADDTAIGILNAVWYAPQVWTTEKEALVRVFASRAASELVRMRRDREILRLSETLEQKVLARTAELQAANAELESFAYSVSHDLRSPLRAINGFTHVLEEKLEGRLDPQEQALFDRVVRNADRMNDLITDLINLARINQGEVQRQQVDLSAMTKEVLTQLQHAQTQHQRQHPQQSPLRVNIQPDVTAFCDSRLARIVLENLLGNALKYTEHTQDAHIEFGCEPPDPSGRTLLFIKDNGAGFDMAYADKLFKPFHRLHHEREFEGSGIGLATVHRILERHGGSIQAWGQPGKGAQFRFCFG